MEQTFSDMLDAEPSHIGRGLIWARTLRDVPVSATKEHLTNGKGFYMSRNMKIILGAVFLLLLLANIASFWFGSLHARQTVGVERVATAQLADAMQQDSFYSQYGDAALLFTGKVTSIQQKGDTRLVAFETSRPYGVTCQISGSKPISRGETISIAAPGGSADRLKNGVLLHNCVIN